MNGWKVMELKEGGWIVEFFEDGCPVDVYDMYDSEEAARDGLEEVRLLERVEMEATY